MENDAPGVRRLSERTNPKSRWPWFVAAGCLLLLCLTILFPPNKETNPTGPSTNTPKAVQHGPSEFSAHDRLVSRLANLQSGVVPGLTASEIVSNKVAQFAHGRRDLARAMAKHFNATLPPEFERFYDAAEAGRFDEMQAIYKSLRKQREDGADKSWYGPQWRTIVETVGVAEAAHDWPAQKLLDYGNAVLGSLRPGMVYLGGTDPGCFIPTLLNETSDGERHMVLTQNALADGTYLEYVNFLYGDRLKTITQDESQRAFQEYLADAQKRLQHDTQFPNEPKQIRPNEDIRVTDNRVQVSGQVAVMTINEKLFQTLMRNNPDVSFAMEQSFPFTSTYANATALGPIMELRVQDEGNAMTAARATQALDYWRTTAQQLLSDPETPDGSDPRKAYSKMAVEQAAFLQDRKYTTEAEQAFKIATEIWPASPEAVFRYVELLTKQNRFADAIPVIENGLRLSPDNQQFAGLLDEVQKKAKR
jgi:tetratricopeptide (TPR) repeat protein